MILQDLAKRYDGRFAVDGLSFAVPAGAIFGVLGPNGAGKSTTMRMIVGVLKPDRGAITLFGAAPTMPALRRVGYLPEERGLYRSMTPRAVIAYYVRLKGLPAREAWERADALLERHGLGAWGRRRIKALSKGMAQKVQILAAIAHEPDFLILDEPFSGLDPVNQRDVEMLIRDAVGRGAAVLFSTHVMEHAERMCDHIVLIAQGKAVFEGAVEEALALSPRTATLETEGAFDLAAALAPAGLKVEAIGAEEGRRRWRAPLDAPDASRRLLAACAAAGAPLLLYEPQRATLHDAFVRLVGGAP
ncbi:MAG: ABC transporter ATP-binding protein [Hyphomonadaceae bacterium]